MSAKANPTVIGAFVAGALILTIVGLLIFGGGRIFKRVDRYVVFFESGVQGLVNGASVTFQGVRVGSVSGVDLLIDNRTNRSVVRVIIEIERDKAQFTGTRIHSRELFQQMIKQGLRAQLRMQSMVTGMLYVGLDIVPNVPARYFRLDSRYPEIPSTPTDIEILKNTITETLTELRKLPVKDMVRNLSETLESINKIVSAPEWRETMKSLNSTMKELHSVMQTVQEQIGPVAKQLGGATSETRKLIATLNEDMQPLIVSLRNASDATSMALGQMQRTLAMESGVPGEVAANLIETSKVAQKTLDQIGRTFSSVEGIGGQDTQFREEIGSTLEEIRKAARSLRTLTDYLEQHPEALLRGKGSKVE